MMLSPFPGMNPYLEGEMWMEFHATFANEIRNQLMPKLMPKYVALLAKYYAVSTTLALVGDEPDRRAVYPDVHITQVSPFPITQAGGVAVMEPTATLQTIIDTDVPIPYIEIRDLADRQLVTVIELLSPVNKVGRAFNTYMDKRTKIIHSGTHLVEIDLVRGGYRLELDGRLPKGDYFAYVSDGRREQFTDVWAIGLRDRLPAIPIPLLSPDPYVPLDLQSAVESCYQTVPYNLLLDYDLPPPDPQMNEDDLAWVREQVQVFRQKRS